MAKYEVAIFIKTDIEKNIPEIQLLEKCSNFSITEMGIHDLAYDIKGQKKAKFLVLNFDNSDTSLLNEFRRRISLNENVLRHLIINLDNDYGAKSLKNSKKVKLSQQKQKKYNE
jgi:small subunit ribosomal protein S6